MVGVGFVKEHLELNGLLTSFEVADLNAANLELPLQAEAFDAVICNFLPYLADPARLIGEACRCVRADGVVALSWTSNSLHQERMTPAWRAMSGSEQVTLVKELLAQAGMHPQSLRVDVSGPTDGDKLFLISASPSAPKKKPAAAVNLQVKDAVGPHQLLHALKDKSKKRADARRQKVHVSAATHCTYPGGGTRPCAFARPCSVLIACSPPLCFSSMRACPQFLIGCTNYVPASPGRNTTRSPSA